MTMVPGCRHEADVLELAAMGSWPDRADESLRSHVATCAVCGDLAEVASGLASWQETALPAAQVPDASYVWRQAERRARADAARRATHPVLAVELAAAAAVVVVLVTWGPALSTLLGGVERSWLRSGWQALSNLFATATAWWATPGWSVSLPSAVRWGLLTLAAWAVLLPVALSLAGLADRLPRPRDGHSGRVG